MAQYAAPEKFDFDPKGWQRWRSTYMTFRMLTKLNDEPGKMQVASLKYCMGPEAEDIMGTFSLTQQDQENFDTVLKHFDEYFQPRKNILRLRKLFTKRTQAAGESVEEFSRALHVMAADCEFGATKEERIRDQFIVGVCSSDLSEKLELLHLSKTNVTLSTVLDYARNYSDVRQGREDEANANVGAVKLRSHGGQAQPSACGYCGYVHEKGRCPAYGKTCKGCGMINHFAKVCQNKGKQPKRVSQKKFERSQGQGRNQGGSQGRNQGQGRHQVREVVEQEEDSEDMFLGEVVDNEEKVWTTSLKMCDSVVKFKVDSGADVSIMTKDAYMELKDRPPLKRATKALVTPAGKLDVLGVFSTEVLSLDNKKSVQMEAYVLPNTPKSCGNLLSRKAATQLGLIQFVGSIEDSTLYGFGAWDTAPVSFTMKEGAVPYAVTAPRRVPIPLMEAVKKALADMEENGVITKVTQPTDWCAPMVPVLKPTQPGEEKKVRICVDYKRLNQSIKREKFSLPTFEELTGKLAGAKVFTKLDAASGFYQIPLDASAQAATTFITPFGRYQYHRLPMGVSLAPEIYQRKMNELLGDLDGVICSMDDVLVFGPDQASHDKRLRDVLERISKSGLKLNKAKCSFRQEEVTFLGHVLTGQGIKISPAKVEAVKKLEAPENVAELRKMLGMINYLTKFVPNAQDVLQPLNVLLQADVAWTWDKPQEDAFQKAKKLLSEAPVLAYFDCSKPTMVSADASSYGIGGVLLQKHGALWRPVAYCSRMLTSVERRWAQIEKECLAAVWACERFHCFVCGIEFELATDHRPLVSLINKKDLSETPLRCQRLLMRFARYAPTAVYVPGRKLVVADLLSRKPLQGQSDGNLLNDVAAHVEYVTLVLPASSSMLSTIRQKQEEDDQIR